jgi:hypothetical protein
MLYEIRVLYQTLSPAFAVLVLTAAGMISGGLSGHIRAAISIWRQDNADAALQRFCYSLAFCKLPYSA